LKKRFSTIISIRVDTAKLQTNSTIHHSTISKICKAPVVLRNEF